MGRKRSSEMAFTWRYLDEARSSSGVFCENSLKVCTFECTGVSRVCVCTCVYVCTCVCSDQAWVFTWIQLPSAWRRSWPGVPSESSWSSAAHGSPPPCRTLPPPGWCLAPPSLPPMENTHTITFSFFLSFSFFFIKSGHVMLRLWTMS